MRRWLRFTKRSSDAGRSGPFTADDVVFAIARVKMEGSDMGYTVNSTWS